MANTAYRMMSLESIIAQLDRAVYHMYLDFHGPIMVAVVQISTIDVSMTGIMDQRVNVKR